MSKKSVSNNIIYNMLFQLFTTLLPVITTPYIARTLGLAQNGIYSFVETIVTLCTVFGAIGTFVYGCRQVAYVREDKDKLSQVAYEVFALKLLLLIPLLAFYIVVFCLNGTYSQYFTICIITIISSAIEISWFFNGIEDFKSVTIRNFIIKIIFVICLFVFIKNPNDLWKYFTLVCVTGFIGNFSMWLLLPKYLLPLKQVKNIRPLKHLKESFSLFIPQSANYIYSLSDKAMLGILTPTLNNVGIYDYAYRIIKMIVGVLQSIGYVILSRIAGLSAKHDEDGIKNYINKSTRFTMFLALPMLFGLIGISDRFVSFYLGNEYLEVSKVIYFLAPLILLTSLNSILGVQLLLAIKKDKEYTKATVIGAITNICLNLLFIPLFGIYGACITSVLSELLVFIIEYKYSRKYVSITNILKQCKYYIFTSILILIICNIINLINMSNIIILSIDILVSMLIYFGIMLLVKDEIMILIVNKFKSIIKRKSDVNA